MYVNVGGVPHNDTNFSVSYKGMSASPDAPLSCNGSGGATIGAVCIVYVWRGVETGPPMDVASTSASTAASNNVDCPSITPTTAGAVVMCTGAFGSTNGATATTTPTTPAGIGKVTFAQV